MSDPLTGLLTRQTLFAVLDDISSRCSPGGGGEHSVLFIDIDHFKRCNDTLGHAQGDRVLIELASLIALELPSPHHLGRDPMCRRSEEHTSELQSLTNLVCRLLLEKKKMHLS